VNTGLTEKQIISILLGKNKNVSFDMFQSTSVLSGYNKSDTLSGIKQLAVEGNIQPEKKGRETVYTVPNKNINIYEAEPAIPSSEINYEENLELFHVLREVRELTSKKFLQSIALICPDEVMTRISKQKPKTKSELLSIPGFTERMFNKIGNDFLEVLNSFVEKNNSDKFIEKKLPSNITETYNLLKKRHTLDEISKLRKLNEAVISMQIETILEYFPKTDISVIVAKDKLDIIRQEKEKGFKELREIKDRLPKDISYSMIRIALAKIKVAS
jgi:ATP-dependent DNA helicase RecQ